MNKFEIKNQFKNKTIIITGHTGFKGSWLTLWLGILGAKIIGISKDIPSKPSFFEALKIKNKIIDIKLDLINLEKLKKIFKKYQPDYVFHLAAQALVKKSYIKPVETFQSNAIGTLNVLEALRHFKKKCITVLITSDKSYKNIEIKRGYREEDHLGGLDPYSSSKASAEFIIQSYINSFFKIKSNNKLIAVARAGNVIGGGDWSKDRIIPDCVKAWSKNQTVIVRNPKSTRPWQHVFEALRGYLVLAINLKKNSNLHGQVFNFGPKNSQNKTVIELIYQARKLWKNIKHKVIKFKTIDHESQLLKLNSSKAKKYLNWEAKLEFSKTIKMVIDWYKYYYFNKRDLHKFSVDQLKNYMKE
jgi:CDP-glucose 4,6-dehydratase